MILSSSLHHCYDTRNNLGVVQLRKFHGTQVSFKHKIGITHGAMQNDTWARLHGI